jgi:hypothetical protein
MENHFLGVGAAAGREQDGGYLTGERLENHCQSGQNLLAAWMIFFTFAAV